MINIKMVTREEIQRKAERIVSFLSVLLLKIVLGIFDVVSDFINGINFFTGDFALGLYFASQTRESYEEFKVGTTLGLMCFHVLSDEYYF